VKLPVITGFLSRLKRKNLGVVERPARPRETEGPQSWDDDIDLTLATLMTDQESKSYGTVQAITLSDFRETIGPLWDQHQDKVLVIAETTIDRMMSKAHTSIRQDEETWLLVTPDLTESQASLFAKEIATSIGEKLIGTRFDDEGDADPTPQTGLVDLGDALNEDGSINKAAIRQAVASAKAVIAARAHHEKRRLAKEKEKENQEPRHHMKPDSDQKKSAQSKGAVTAEDGLKIKYLPAWSADSQSIDTFYCRGFGVDGQSPFSRDDPVLVGANAIAVARACTVALNAMIKDGIRAKLVVPIPFSVIASPAQRQIISAFMRLEESHRFLYLRPEIVDVPHSSSATEILTARDILQPIGRNVAVCMDLFDPNRAVLSAGKIMVGCDALVGAGEQPAVVRDALKDIQRVAGKRPTYALGLEDQATVAKAVELGFSEVGGTGLQAPLKARPDSTKPLPRDQLLNVRNEMKVD
jgi:hypothetical protein